MKDQPQHFHKDAQPTVIHDPTADETLLAQWLRRGMEKGPAFWALLLGVVVVLFGVFFLVNQINTRQSPDAAAWLEVMVPSTALPPGETPTDANQLQALLDVAETYPTSSAARWARYQAGLRLYQEGITNLPTNKDAARPALSQALKAFEEVLDSAKADDPVRPFALMGQARCHESRGELKEAREAYLQVADQFAGTPLADSAKKRAEALEDPLVVAFYDELYKGDFSRGVEPAPPSPFGTGTGSPSFPSFGAPSLRMPEGFDPLGPAPPTLNPPASSDLPTLPGEATPATQPAPTPAGDLPSSPFAPGGPDASATPTPQPEAQPDAGLPDEPFAPAESGSDDASPRT